MKNLVLLLLLVCTFHGICVSLECYKCTFSDEGCQDLSISAQPGFETCPDGSICHVTQTFLAIGDVVYPSRGCIPDSDCYNGCNGFVSESIECTSCCNEDRCNSGVPIVEDVSCYECYNLHFITGEGSTACDDDPFNPNDDSIRTTTCSSGQCAVYSQKGLSKNTVAYRGCQNSQFQCRSTKTQCKGSECIDCCSGNLCNGQVTARSIASIEQSTASVANNKQATNNLSSNGQTTGSVVNNGQTTARLAYNGQTTGIEDNNRQTTGNVAVNNRQVTGGGATKNGQTTVSVTHNEQATNDVSSNGQTINVASYGRNICVMSLASIWLNWFINN
ncbi:uncharacterized protein [Asterias amurensis]|uniref:uncharacterized protein n=1 Tax=Asterias amurensis TaxID=7602 RepID=UPI003AB651D0